ncbi:MAG: AAA family ATPase [Nanoarchaeota archaeon]|nr:AAA family ATPase [Nanoarchaeota archaeon]
MALFGKMLKEEESVFKDPIALDYDYMPKLIKGRGEEQRKIALAIKPLDQNRTGGNLVLFGDSGVGKTVICKHMLRIVEEEADDILPIYVNCWKKNTSYKIFVDVCEQLGYRLTHNKKTDELFEVIKRLVNKKSVVFVFDEIDKSEDLGFLYSILEEIYRKSILMITNEAGWHSGLDQRIKSRLMAGMVEFNYYNSKETEDILNYRKDYAFVEGAWDEKSFSKIISKTVKLEDVRSGLYIMREAGNNAENRSSKKIEMVDVDEAIKRLDDFNIKSIDSLEPELKLVLKIVKGNEKCKIGELYDKYKVAGGDKTYKTFQRSIKKLSDNKFISTKTFVGGTGGSTTLVDYSKDKSKPLTKMKKLSDF